MPVYFYEEAALSPSAAIWPRCDAESTKPLRAPDRTLGTGLTPPATFNPRSGACIIGALVALIAFNVNLGTTDLDIAQRIARAVRYSSGASAPSGQRVWSLPWN